MLSMGARAGFHNWYHACVLTAPGTRAGSKRQGMGTKQLLMLPVIVAWVPIASFLFCHGSADTEKTGLQRRPE
jgi:hypothetical protein